MINQSNRPFSSHVWLICQDLLGWLVLATSLAQGQPTVLRLNADSLQKSSSGYSLYPMPWRFHPGNSLHWAELSFNDRGWMLTKTGFNVDNPPPGWQGTGWFRLHFRVDSSLVSKLLAFRIGHMGASEIYLDGVRIGGFGSVGYSTATEHAYLPDNEPIAFRLGQSGEHVLAVRFSSFHHYLTRKVRYGQGFVSWIAPNDQMNRYVHTLVRSSGLSLIPFIGSGLLAILHLFLYLYYPAQKSNGYYSICLTFFSSAAFLVFLEGLTTSPGYQQAIFYVLRFLNIAYVVASVAFAYSVAYPRQPRRTILFYALGVILYGLFVLFPINPFIDLWLVFLGLSTLEVLRVVLQGVKRKQPGIWLIGVGMLATTLVYYMAAWNALFLLPGNPAGQYLFMTLGFLLLPFLSSLYLAQDFARTSRNLETQLRQVQALSAQTLAQETDKLRLVALQKEELEQTVRERTRQLQNQADKLREVNETKTRFFTNLAHEFRTPLTLMLGPAEQIVARSQETDSQQQAGLLQANAQRLLGLVNQLLDLSKLEAGKTTLSLSSGDLIALVEGMLLSFEPLAHQKQIILRWQSAADQLLMDMDRDKLEKIFSNLFSNALKFTPAGGAVSVTITHESVADEPWGQVTVQDTGTGIPADKLPYVFNQFYQVDSSDTREQEGFGIGLALTKELVELHGGTIAISSTEKSGTLVTVRLPLCQPQYGKVTRSELTPRIEPATTPIPLTKSPLLQDYVPGEVPVITEDLPGSGRAVAAELLLIEDNDQVRQFIRSSLEPQYRVREAAGGEEGLHLARQYVPDLVITDLMMPRLDGYQVCRQLKQDQRTSHIPVLMLTAKADLDSRIEGLQTGVDSYLAKPFHERELLAQIANLITTRWQLRERYRREKVWQSSSSELPSQEQVFLNRVRVLIEAHLEDEHFGVDQLSEQLAMSRTQLHRKLTALLDYSPGELIRLLRLEHALTLLTHNVASVSEVAYRVGFANPASFSASFSRHFGFSPNEVKKKAGSPAS